MTARTPATLAHRLLTKAEAAANHEKHAELFRWLARHCWEGDDIDGYELQEKMKDAGVLIATLVSKPCGKYCNCADFDAEFPTECYRLAPEFRGKEIT